MRLIDVRDAVTALGITRPWSFTGANLVDTLACVDLMWGTIRPPFPLDLKLSLPFLLVQHSGHVPESSIHGLRTLRELELEILSGAGYMNNFVTHCVAFIEERASRFRILFRDASGAEVEFDKARQIQENDYGRQYPGRRIEWW